MTSIVAPVRERGLKSVCFFKLYLATYRRSRKGAWIEIPTLEKLWPYGYKSLP